MSSTPNRRLHDDGSGSASKYPHEDHVTYPVNTGKAVTPKRPDYHLPYDVGTVSKSADRRLSTFPPASLFRSANDEHVVGSETRADFQDSVGKDIRVENRGLKPEGGKDVRHERDPYLEHKSEVRVDKDVYSVSNIQFGWKEQRSKMQHDGHGGNVDAWPAPRGVVQGPAEAGKEGLHNEVAREVVEGREVAKENKVDMKGDDKFREKERKRKEMKHRDWAERDKERSDRRNISQLLLGGGSGEIKEVRREERESERWAVEKKDKEKIVEKEKEKVHVKRETGTGPDKDISHGEKEPVAVQGKSVEQESSALELKKKEHNTLKNAERDGKREKEADIESERPDKRGRFHEKEAEECGVESEGGVEREREAFNSTVQQRKRLLRPRGSPQTGNRDLRVGPQSNDIEGSQGQADGPCVVYKIGECMQELIKLWEEYALSQADKTSESLRNGPTLEIRIPAEHVTATNRQVRGGQLWGTDVYTVDSDLVAVLMHTGYCRPTATPPPPAAQQLRATIRVLPPQDGYISSLRNNVRSRAWGAAIGCSYCVERCWIVKKGGGSIELEPCLTHSSTMEPTLAPVAAERTMTTRAAASNALRQQRFVREVTIQFNLCMEPWLKYSISAVADKGLKKPLFTSSRLKKGEVLYVETHSCRYELCYSGEKVVKAAAAAAGAEPGRIQSHNSQHIDNGTASVDGENSVVDVFRWSRCKRPLPQKMMLTVGIPLPSEKVEVVAGDLEWDGITWSQTGVWIAGREYHLARAHFLAAK